VAQPRQALAIRIASLLFAAVVWGQPQDAALEVGELQKATRLNPADAEAHARLGLVYRRLGRLPEAIESLDRARRLDPKLPRVNVLLAFAYMDAGRCPDAIPLLAADFDADPKPPVRLVVGRRLAECSLAAGEQERALAVVEKLRQIAPDDPEVLQLALRVYMTSWNGAFQRLLTKAPDSYQAREIMAESLEAQQRFAEAANEYRQILKTEPRLAGLHYKLGRMILRSETSSEADEKALAEFRQELEIQPANVAALAEIGEIHLKGSRIEEASRSFSQAVKLQPGYVPARVGLAKVLLAAKQWPEALEHLEAAAKLAPQDEAVHYNLMIAYRGLERPADAKRAFDTFQRLKRQNQQNRPTFLLGAPPQ